MPSVSELRDIRLAGKRHTPPHYKGERLEDDLTADIAGCIAELAVAKATNRYWHAHYWHATEHNANKGLPDVGSNIEVRRVRDNTYQNVAIREYQLGLGLVIFAAHPIMPEMRQVDIWGWAEQDKVWERAKPWKEDKTMRWLNKSLLTPLNEGS